MLVSVLTGCGNGVGVTPYLHTNTNEFRLFPLDIKKPTIVEDEITEEVEGTNVGEVVESTKPKTD